MGVGVRERGEREKIIGSACYQVDHAQTNEQMKKSGTK